MIRLVMEGDTVVVASRMNSETGVFESLVFLDRSNSIAVEVPLSEESQRAIIAAFEGKVPQNGPLEVARVMPSDLRSPG